MPHEILVPICMFLSVAGIGGSVVMAIAAQRNRLKARLVEGEPGSARSAHSMNVIALVGKLVAGKGPSQKLQQRLAQAGYHNESASTIFLGAKVIVFTVGAAAGFLAVVPTDYTTPHKLILGLSVAMAFGIVPDILVRTRRNKRRKQIRLHLPDAVDLLEICVSSGMGLDMAWNSVAKEIRHVSVLLADEMTLANLEIHMGAERAVALRHMAERTGADEISSLVATLVQSEKFGTSVAEALKVFAESMRVQRSQNAEEAAEKMAVKLIFPMVLFFFPAMMIVMIGPAVLKIMELFAD